MKDFVKVTHGMRNAMMKGKTIARRCRKCRQAFPAYPGRYPSACPHCGGAVGGPAQNESEESPLSVVCASTVPRIQRLIDRGHVIEEAESFVSSVMVVSFEDIEESVPGGVRGLRWFLEESPNTEGVFYRIESPDDPVLVLEVDEQSRRALVLATTDPSRFLGFDPRAELVEQELAPIEEQGGGPGGARGVYSRETRKSVLSKPPESGRGAHRAHGGFRFEIGKNKKRKARKDVVLSIQNRLNAQRGTASRIRAAKKWHRSALGREYHGALGRYNQGNRRGEGVEESMDPAVTNPTSATAASERSVDDVFEAMLRKLVFIESTDILQDVEFTDAGSIYFFFDPSIPRPDIDEVVMKLAEEDNRAQLVASPDMTLEGESAKADWWVVFVPIAEGEGADPEVYSSDPDAMLGDQEPPTQQMVTKAVTPVDQIGMSLDTDKLIQSVGESVVQPVEERLQRPSPKGYYGIEAADLYDDLYKKLRDLVRGIRGVTVDTPLLSYRDPYGQLPRQYAVRVVVRDPMTDFEPAEVFLVFLEKETGNWYYNSYNVSESSPGQTAPIPRREMTWSNMPTRPEKFREKVKREADHYARRAAYQLQLQTAESAGDDAFDDSEITEAAVAKLEEGIFDPFILKAVFLAGGGGSGKGFIGGHLFNGLGLVSVNPDRALEARINAEIKALRTGKVDDKLNSLLQGVISGQVQAAVPPEAIERLRTAAAGSAAYKAAEKEVFNAILGSDYGQKVIRPWVKMKREAQRKNVVAGRLGLLIDGTGAKPDKIRKEKAELEALGYDTYMIFVDTAMDVALARNKMRKRHVPEKVVIEDWNLVRAAIPTYKAMWGKDFVRIDNTRARGSDEVKRILGPDLRRIAMTLIARPLKNPIGWDWLRNEARLLGVDHSKVTWLSGRGSGSRGGAAGAFGTKVQQVARRLSGESRDPYLFWLRAGSGEPKMQGALTEETFAEYSGLAAEGKGRLFVVQAENVAAARRIIDAGEGLKQTAPNVFSNED